MAAPQRRQGQRLVMGGSKPQHLRQAWRPNRQMLRQAASWRAAAGSQSAPWPCRSRRAPSLPRWMQRTCPRCHPRPAQAPRRQGRTIRMRLVSPALVPCPRSMPRASARQVSAEVIPSRFPMPTRSAARPKCRCPEWQSNLVRPAALKPTKRLWHPLEWAARPKPSRRRARPQGYYPSSNRQKVPAGLPIRAPRFAAWMLAAPVRPIRLHLHPLMRAVPRLVTSHPSR